MKQLPIQSLSLLPLPQIRLAELSVFNWGSFHGLHTAHFDEQGTLITGDNGSGKSTLIDGLMALLLPASRANFNMAAAQNDRSDRTLVSYMRGSFGSAHDGSSTRVKSKRDKGVVTGLRALYQGDDGSQITLAALFWTSHASNLLSDVRRLYVISRKALSLETLLAEFPDANVRKLKNWLDEDEAITYSDSFGEYQTLYRRLLHMHNPNAPALLSRALGLKKIDDLTDLIRTLVLEPSNTRQEARAIVDEFADLVATHNQLEDTRKQVEQLQDLPDIADDLAAITAELSDLKAQKDSLPTYFALCHQQLLADQIDRLQSQLSALSYQIVQTESQEDDANASVQKFRDAYMNLGGNRIENLKRDLGTIDEKIAGIAKSASRYQTMCRQLELPAELDAQTFASNQKRAEGKQANLESNKLSSQNDFADSATAFSEAQKQSADIEAEIKEIAQRPDSNIPLKYQQLRDKLCQELALEKEALIFVGELIDVQEKEQAWQGAIERALGGIRTTLLVPEYSFSLVTGWLNRHHTGLYVRVQVAGKPSNKKSVVFEKAGFLRKLQWRKHDYRDWLKQHLSRFDLTCVNSTAELDETPFSMTKAGLIHKEQGHFDKKDQTRIDDRRAWYLGFSNHRQLGLLERDKQQVSEDLAALQQQLNDSRKAMNKVSDQFKLWEKILNYDWSDLDLLLWQEKRQRNQDELDAIQSADGDLKAAESRWEAAKAELQHIQQSKTDLLVEKGGKEQALYNAEQLRETTEQLAQQGLDDDMHACLSALVGVVDLDNDQQQIQAERQLSNRIEQLTASKSSNERQAISIMSGFRSKDCWQPLTVAWHTGLAGIEDYLTHLRRLQREGLPALLEQFKMRLNKHTTQSLANFKRQFEDIHEDIRSRIRHINNVLRKTEFRQNSHLKINSKRENFAHVADFEEKIGQALAHINHEDHELRFQLLKEVVEMLDKASDAGTAHTLESQRLLDPRFQLSFYAEEIDFDTLEVKDVLNSSSGKSGGEKESFAGMIVAASLAYVLTPEHADKPVYSTVFLDEAFSNTAETVSRRVLRVFKELHIHVNLITPYKNLNLARESARSLIIAERDPDVHESNLCEVTWQEIDAMRAGNTQRQAKDLGIDLE
ncbi:MAG: hypothetical protein CR974_03155 [Gammaproteobacteria bacterium]|nr:MAG: hypothetical protein CR974_03155 [Gammaproteobacteria bacterium]